MGGSNNDEKKKEEEDEDEKAEGVAKAMPPQRDDDSDSDSSEEEDDLNLEGVLIRNPDASSSSSSSEEDDSDDDENGKEEEEEDKKMPAKSSSSHKKSDAAKSNNDNNKKKRTAATAAMKNTGTSDKKKPATTTTMIAKKKKKKKKKQKKDRHDGPEIINVEFTFHDFDEKFFHGVKNLLRGCSTVYQPHSSALTDLMIDNISVGTVCSTEGDTDGNVFGFGSVLNVTTYGDKPCIRYLKKICLDNCPKERRTEMETVLSGTTARPAGFFFHSRMVNMPLEIVEVLQNQLVLDMDWAVKNAEGGEVERKSLDFGAFVRLAPATMDNGGALIYRFFDDEIFSTNAEFTYNINAPPSYGSEEKQMVSIIVMTKTGHRAAMQELKQLVGSAG